MWATSLIKHGVQSAIEKKVVGTITLFKVRSIFAYPAVHRDVLHLILLLPFVEICLVTHKYGAQQLTAV
jgi:hypothetical protein